MKISKKVKQNYKKISIVIILIIFNILFFVPVSYAANVCKASISFDVNPKTAPLDVQMNLSGNVDMSETTFASDGTCLAQSGLSTYTIDEIRVQANINGNSVNIFADPASQFAQQNKIDFLGKVTPASQGLTIGQTTSIAAQVFAYSKGQQVAALRGSAPVTIKIAGAENGPTNLPKPTMSVDKTTASLGDTVNVIFNNMPAGAWAAQVSINGSQSITSCSTQNCPITLSTEKGAKNGANTITAQAKDGAGNDLTLEKSSVVVNIGAAAPGPTPGSMQSNSSDKLYNPLPEGDLVHAFLIVAQGFLAILGVLAVVFIIVGGFQMTIAAGNEEALVKAKKTIIWAILGLVVAILSFSIIAIVQDLLQVQIQPSSTSINKIERKIS